MVPSLQRDLSFFSEGFEMEEASVHRRKGLTASVSRVCGGGGLRKGLGDLER